jgi:hypothetical protein
MQYARLTVRNAILLDLRGSGVGRGRAVRHVGPLSFFGGYLQRLVGIHSGSDSEFLIQTGAVSGLCRAPRLQEIS